CLEAAHTLPSRELPRELSMRVSTMIAERDSMDRALARFGADLLPAGGRILTHCNTGALATGGIGTALGVIRESWERGALEHVFVDETRPRLQGARLTAWELQQLGIPFTLIPDSAAASLMAQGKVDAIIVGADRIAANGDVANKIGTYSLAVNASYHHLPFYVAAPWSTFDLTIASGDQIPIEERSPDEVLNIGSERIAPAGIDALNLAFDVTPAELITAIVTERGVPRAPFVQSLEAMAGVIPSLATPK
ncbi:MAG TPA: S-methyl-5-thioribose-1-phosphate isomerase, partial [Thermomicrobiaceae bacterium]|nr:S-methyl-5-thioribose-1-phosphate isomerase [Thermomicrobiaceae bacterium]